MNLQIREINFSHLLEDRSIRFVLIFLMTFLWQFLFLILISPLVDYDYGDSIVYKQMGLALLQGKLLYIDLFDHKGPILYFVHYICLLLGNERWNLFLLHVLNYSLATFLMSETVACFIKGWKGLYPIFLGIILYLGLRTYGDSSEDWCIVPISYALCLGVNVLTLSAGDVPSRRSLILLGLSAGIVLFVRANNGAIPLCTFFLILSVDRKNWLKTILYVSLGFFVVLLLVLLYFYLVGGQNYISAMIYGTFLFNLSYAAKAHAETVLYETSFFFDYVVILFALVLFLLFRPLRDNRLVIYGAGCLILSFLTMGHNGYGHYLIPVIPLYVLLSSISIPGRHWAWCLFLGSVFLLTKFPLGLLHSNFVNPSRYAQFYEDVDAVVAQISESERSKVWNYNTAFIGPAIIHRNRIVQCNKVFHQFQFEYSDWLREECKDELVKKAPEWIVVNESSNITPQDSAYLSDHYVVKDEVSSAFIGTKVQFYKRKK